MRDILDVNLGQIFAFPPVVLALVPVALLTWAWSTHLDRREIERGDAAQSGRVWTAWTFGICIAFNTVDAIAEPIDHWALLVPRIVAGFLFIGWVWEWVVAEFRRSRQPVRKSARAI